MHDSASRELSHWLEENKTQRTKLVATYHDWHPNVHRAICALNTTSPDIRVRERFWTYFWLIATQKIQTLQTLPLFSKKPIGGEHCGIVHKKPIPKTRYRFCWRFRFRFWSGRQNRFRKSHSIWFIEKWQHMLHQIPFNQFQSLNGAHCEMGC